MECCTLLLTPIHPPLRTPIQFSLQNLIQTRWQTCMWSVDWSDREDCWLECWIQSMHSHWAPQPVECNIVECHFALHLSWHSALQQSECHFNPHSKMTRSFGVRTPRSGTPEKPDGTQFCINFYYQLSFQKWQFEKNTCINCHFGNLFDIKN